MATSTLLTWSTRIRFGQQIRSTEDLKVGDRVTISKKELKYGFDVDWQHAEKFDVSKFKDDNTESLLNIIKAKAKGKPAKVKKLTPKKTGSDDLYDQLMASLTKKGA